MNDLKSQATITPISFDPPASPAPKDVGVYMMVFTGTLGGESPIADGPGAVVAKLVKMPLPELYVSQNGLSNFNGADFATFDLFYNVPKQFEALVRDNVARTHLKVNGIDYPPTDPANVDQCGYPSVFITGQKLGYLPQNSDFFEWSAMFFQSNQVLWSDRVGDVAVATSEPDVAAQLEAQGYEPQCGTEILLNDMSNPYQNTRIEYYIWNQLLFGLCYRYEITADNSLNLVV